MKTFLSFGLIILLAHSIAAVSNEPFPVDSESLEKLFQPVDQAIQNKLFEENKFSLKRATYFGKRHRIVKVNMDLLSDNGKAFVVNPFSDVDLIVKTKKISTYSDGMSQKWVAEKLNSRLDTDHEEVPQHLKTQLNSMNLSIRSFRHEEHIESPMDITGHAISPDPYKLQIRSKLYISGTLVDCSNQYRVLPTDSTAEYYLIVELDPKKSLLRGTSDEAQKRRTTHMNFDKELREAEARLKNDRLTKKGDLK